MQLQHNDRQSRRRPELRDVTNTTSPAEGKKKRHDKGRKRQRSHSSESESGHKRPRRAHSSEPETRQEDEDESSSDLDDNTDDATKVKRAGRLHVLNYSPWIRGNARIFEEELDPGYDEKKRFENTGNKIQVRLLSDIHLRSTSIIQSPLT